MNTIALQLRYRTPAPVRLRLAQANAVRLSCEWADAAVLPAAFDLVAEIHASRTVAPGSTPLAAQLVPALTSASADPWVIDFSSAQLNHPIPNPPSRRLWMVVYLRTALAVVTVAAAEIELEYHAISGITPAPPAPAIYLTPEAAAELFASIDDVDALTDRVTALENDEGGGSAVVQIDWAAVAGPASILNKPSLGNSSSRNVGTGASDVATGNHTHSSTSQIAGLDTALAGKAASSHGHAIGDVSGLSTALAGKADLSGGKVLASQIPAVALAEYLGPVASQSAMLALVGQPGDWCTRTDQGKVWIVTAEPSSLLANWFEMVYPASPVTTVAGKTGTVTLGIGDIFGLQGVLDAKVNADALQGLAFRDTVGSAQIDAGAVGNAKLEPMAAATIKGSIAGGTPADLTPAQVNALLLPSPGAIGGTTPGAGTFSSLTSRGLLTMRATGSGFASDIQTFATGTSIPTNTESAYFGWRTLTSVPVAVIGTTAAGGGTAREIEIQPGGVAAARFTTDGRMVVGGTSASTNTLLTINSPSSAMLANIVGAQCGIALRSGSGNIVLGETSIASGPFGGAFSALYQNDGAACAAADRLGGFLIGGATSPTSIRNAAIAEVYATELYTASASGSAWNFATTENGTNTRAGKVWINHNGNVGIGYTAPDSVFNVSNQPAARLHVRGANTGTGLCLRLDDSGGIQRFGVQDNGGVLMGAPLVLSSFTVATVPAASLWTRGLIWVSDETGGRTPAFSDGTNWRRVADGLPIAPSS